VGSRDVLPIGNILPISNILPIGTILPIGNILPTGNTQVLSMCNIDEKNLGFIAPLHAPVLSFTATTQRTRGRLLTPRSPGVWLWTTRIGHRILTFGLAATPTLPVRSHTGCPALPMGWLT
jgi:hypothetical protein